MTISGRTVPVSARATTSSGRHMRKVAAKRFGARMQRNSNPSAGLLRRANCVANLRDNGLLSMLALVHALVRETPTRNFSCGDLTTLCPCDPSRSTLGYLGSPRCYHLYDQTLQVYSGTRPGDHLPSLAYLAHEERHDCRRSKASLRAHNAT